MCLAYAFSLIAGKVIGQIIYTDAGTALHPVSTLPDVRFPRFPLCCLSLSLSRSRPHLKFCPKRRQVKE